MFATRAIRARHGRDERQRRQHGIAEMMVDLYERFAEPLTHDKLFEWHKMLMSGDRQIQVIGGFPTHPQAMQAVGPRAGQAQIHFLAPPSKPLRKEVEAFLARFHATGPYGRNTLPALCRAS